MSTLPVVVMLLPCRNARPLVVSVAALMLPETRASYSSCSAQLQLTLPATCVMPPMVMAPLVLVMLPATVLS